MRVVVDLTPLKDHLTGVERYAMCIARSMIRQFPEDDYLLIFKDEIHSAFSEELKNSHVKALVLPGCGKLKFIQWRLFRAVRRIDADAFLFLSFTGPVLFRRKGIVNAIHDLTCWDCPETIPRKMVAYYRIAYHAAVKCSSHLITVSEFSRMRIASKYRLDPAKIMVIYDGLAEQFSEISREPSETVRERYHLPSPYLLSLSTIEPRKNLQLLLTVYSQMLDEGEALPDLVLAGRSGWKTEGILSHVSSGIRNRIHFTGYIEDGDLPALYREAELFLFPSKYEGFGLPVIEAMSQGTLVLSSDAASLPEVAGDAGILFRSGDAEDLKQKIRDALRMSGEEKNRRIRSGLNVSHRFSWDREADRLHRLLEMDQMSRGGAS